MSKEIHYKIEWPEGKLPQTYLNGNKAGIYELITVLFQELGSLGGTHIKSVESVEVPAPPKEAQE